jgi:ATP-binding cassette subfamily B protein
MKAKLMLRDPNIRFIIASLKPFKFWILGFLIVNFILAMDLSLSPYFLKTIINKTSGLAGDQPIHQLLKPICLYLAFSLLITAMTRLDDYIWLKLNAPLKQSIVHTLVQKMMSHSLVVFQNHFAGNLANQIKDVMNGIPSLLRLIVLVFTSRVLALAIAALTVWNIHYKFAALLLAWLVIFVIGNSLFTKRAKQLADQAATAKSYIVGQIVDILSNITAVHLFAGQKAESKSLKKHLDRYVVSNQEKDWWFLGLFTFQGLSFIIYQAIGFLFLVNDFKGGCVTSGDFALLLTINIGLIHRLWGLSYDIMGFSELIGETIQGLRVALAPYDIQDLPHAKELHVSQGHIVFKDVKFHYKGTKPLFQDLSVNIEPGQRVGLVGYSGSGKTSFVNVLLRLYDITGGQILIDGQDIQTVTQDSLHRHIATVPQDLSLFHRTLMDNIRYGCMSASKGEVIEAAKKADAHRFISQLPQG